MFIMYIATKNTSVRRQMITVPRTNGIREGWARWNSRSVCRTRDVHVKANIAEQMEVFPTFLPIQYVREIEEEAALRMAAKMKRVPVMPSGWESEVYTSFVSTPHVAEKTPPLVLLHGFDSSCLEFRRLLPLLEEASIEAHAVDLVGWGFTDASNAPDVGPSQKREHLKAFWKEHLGGRPIALMGCSLGGAVAIDFALNFPEAVEKLILVDAQVRIVLFMPMLRAVLVCVIELNTLPTL